jgi:hypothetical protein
MACCGLGDPQLRWTDEERSVMAEDRIPMTREGYDKLKAELDRFRSVEMIEITKRVATAREMGDLSENAEYHAKTRAFFRPGLTTFPIESPGPSSSIQPICRKILLSLAVRSG